jgi:hypothetical protein
MKNNYAFRGRRWGFSLLFSLLTQFALIFFAVWNVSLPCEQSEKTHFISLQSEKENPQTFAYFRFKRIWAEHPSAAQCPHFTLAVVSLTSYVHGSATPLQPWCIHSFEVAFFCSRTQFIHSFAEFLSASLQLWVLSIRALFLFQSVCSGFKLLQSCIWVCSIQKGLRVVHTLLAELLLAHSYCSCAELP